jgi:hypothetical protein
VTIQNAENYWPSDTTSCPRRPESSLPILSGCQVLLKLWQLKETIVPQEDSVLKQITVKTFRTVKTVVFSKLNKISATKFIPLPHFRKGSMSAAQ